MPTLAIQLRAASKDRLLVVFFLLAIFVFALDVALLLWKIPAIGAAQDVIALHYNVFFGVDRTGSWKIAFLAPVVGAVVIAVNSVMAVKLHASERFVARACAVNAILVNAFLVAGSLFLILANL
jgi:hypothetical protein